MRITKRTNIAVRLLMYCAAHQDRLVTKSEIAEVCNISENHLAQVINQLSQLELPQHAARSQWRHDIGAARDQIRIGSVFRHVEGQSADCRVFCGCRQHLPADGCLPVCGWRCRTRPRCSMPRWTKSLWMLWSVTTIRCCKILQPVACMRSA